MKAAGKKTLHKLIVDEPDNYLFLGISSTEPDYKISFKINDRLGISLRSCLPLIPLHQPHGGEFPRFCTRPEPSGMFYHLVKNRTETGVFSKNYPSIDYIFLICDIEDKTLADKIKDKLKTISSITALFILNNDKLEEEYNLLQLS